MLGHSGKSVSSHFTFEAHFTLPNGMDTSFQFYIYPPDCTSLTHTGGATSPTNYIVGAVLNIRDFTWTALPSGCLSTYDATVSGSPNTLSTSFFTRISSGRGMKWYTTDFSAIGTYTIRITAKSGCCANSCSLTD